MMKTGFRKKDYIQLQKGQYSIKIKMPIFLAWGIAQHMRTKKGPF
jgi:hypothetical protein